jgi:hypothetical protein
MTAIQQQPATIEHRKQQLFARGRSLSLRYPTAHDAPALFELASDPEVTRFFSWGP